MFNSSSFPSSLSLHAGWFVTNMTQDSMNWEEETLTERMGPSDWPTGALSRLMIDKGRSAQVCRDPRLRKKASHLSLEE